VRDAGDCDCVKGVAPPGECAGGFAAGGSGVADGSRLVRLADAIYFRLGFDLPLPALRAAAAAFLPAAVYA